MSQKRSSMQIIDCRNARYQGPINQQGNRQGFGVLIDDDLSFYASQWTQNILSGPSLVYISHGKYIYGEWQNNQPNGLNVFRSGDTVLVGQFNNGQLIGRILVIFEKYNIIAVLQKLQNSQKLQIVQCGKLYNHEQLIKYIDMLDIQMPQYYFSLIKFVNYLSQSEINVEDNIITTPCQNGNCYFGFKQGLAITFNSNNGVVSVGYHQNKLLTGYGGKFDGVNIQQGNFQLEQTITYNKKRPNNQIYTIFQKMHKRSLNFKNHYFDSKVKTLGNLQSLLRGNIQKIVNYNMKNKIDSTTVNQLNDSLDYQNIDQYQSSKNIQNRVNMYENQKQTAFSRKNSQHFKVMKEKEKKYENGKFSQQQSRANQSYKVQTSKGANTPSNYHMNLELNKKQSDTVRKSQYKQNTQTSNVYYAKKSPIRYKQEYGKKFAKDSEESQKQVQQELINKPFSKNIQQFERNRNKCPLNLQKPIERKQVFDNSKIKKSVYQRASENKIPKFGGLQLQIQQPSTPKKQPYHENRIQKDIQNYRLQLQKSRSIQKGTGRSISKVLKRPNYQQVQQRRQRLLSQFKDLNDKNQTTSRISNNAYQNSGSSKIQRDRSPIRPYGNQRHHQISIDVIENNYSGKNSVNQSPCVKQKIDLFSSESQNKVSQSSTEGYMPLTLLNERSKNKNDNQRQRHNNGSFVKKDSAINKFTDKQNVSYTAGSFSKYKQNRCQQQTDVYNVKKFNPSNEQNKQKIDSVLQPYNRNRSTIDNMIQKKTSKYNQQNRFSQIELKTQNKYEQNIQSKYNRCERDLSPISGSNIDISKRRKSYKYYFD